MGKRGGCMHCKEQAVAYFLAPGLAAAGFGGAVPALAAGAAGADPALAAGAALPALAAGAAPVFAPALPAAPLGSQQARSISSPSLLTSGTLKSPTPVPRPISPAANPSQDADKWDASETAWNGGESAATSGPIPPPLAGMSKEDKAAEMTRRREERKQRIAQLKEQKKAGGRG